MAVCTCKQGFTATQRREFILSAADPVPLVAAGARAAVNSICCWAGYGSLQALVSTNADYIVDGMCRQLRQLEAYPRAPQLFAALLRETGVAPALLLLLAEPARAALSGISILMRRAAPQNCLAFLQALGQVGGQACLHVGACMWTGVRAPIFFYAKADLAHYYPYPKVAAGASAVACPALVEIRRVATALRTRWDAHQVELGIKLDAPEVDSVSKPASMAEVETFFEQQQQQREWAEDGEGAPHDDVEAANEAQRVAMTMPEQDALLLAKRQMHAAASLAQAIADTAGMLVLSQSLAVAVQAFGVCTSSLQVLRLATEAAELFQYKIKPIVRCNGNVAPTDPDLPRLLPSVHLLWSPMMSALKDWRIAVVEAALTMLADLVALAGGFLTRRFGNEAVPALIQLLREGLRPRRNMLVPGETCSNNCRQCLFRPANHTDLTTAQHCRAGHAYFAGGHSTSTAGSA